MARKSNTALKDEAETEAAVESAAVEQIADVAAEETKIVYPSTEQMIADGLTTKSARIRHLHSLGMSTGDIARQETGGLYQHAYNVIHKPLKRPAAEVTPQNDATPEVEG